MNALPAIFIISSIHIAFFGNAVNNTQPVSGLTIKEFSTQNEKIENISEFAAEKKYLHLMHGENKGIATAELKEEFTPGSIDIEDNAYQKYSIEVAFPRITNTNTEINQEMQTKINKQIKTFINEYIDGFKKQCSEIDMAGPANKLSLDYSIMRLDKKILSIRFYGIAYYGGAHGTHVTLVQNYNLDTGNPIELHNLFEKGFNYEKTLSEHSIKSLTKQIYNIFDTNVTDEDILNEQDNSEIKSSVQAAARAKFRNFNLTPDTLILNFGDQEGFAYVFGGKLEVKIPYIEFYPHFILQN